MHILVDGYNYLHRARLLDRDLQAARRRLAERVRVLRRAGDQVTIVWDSRRATRSLDAREPQGGVEHEYARRTGSADDEILATLRHADDARGYCVISDDGDVARPAKQLGARVLSVRDAEREIERLRGRAIGGGKRPPRGRGRDAEDDGADEKPPPPSADEAREWLERFQQDDGS